MYHFFFVFFLFLFAKHPFAQTVTVSNQLHSPLGIPLQLSATFGDIRPNHFHMGLDFRTNGREGIPIHAIMDGYISRIKISSSGYGRALYICHPNGQTSVYAHCSKFNEEIACFVEAFQFISQQNDIDCTLSKNEILVKKGKLIAYTGNSGNSTGPHLHFELRDTETEHALNPLLHGFHLQDYLSPTIRSIKLYAVDAYGYRFPGKEITYTWNEKRKNFGIPNNLIIVDQSFLPQDAFLAFGVEANDQMSQKTEHFGIYSTKTILNQDTMFHTCLDNISFEHSRYVNSHKDYEAYKEKKQKIHKLFKNVANPLEVYKLSTNGAFRPIPNDTMNVEIIVGDVNQQFTRMNLRIVYNEKDRPEPQLFYSPQSHFIPDSAYQFKTPKYEVNIAPYTFYEPTPKILKFQERLQIGQASVPIQQNIQVKLLPKQQHSAEKQYISLNGQAQNCEFHAPWIETNSKNLGIFETKIDTVPPVIQSSIKMPKDSLIVQRTLQWKIFDSGSGIKSYNLWVNGIWTPVYLDAKNALISFERKNIHVSEQHLLLRVEDACANDKEWEATLCFDSPLWNETP
jgi:hypothetical protein